MPYAVLKDNLVIDYFINNSLELAEKTFPNCTFIEMTPENSPAFVGGLWDGKEFYPPKLEGEK